MLLCSKEEIVLLNGLILGTHNLFYAITCDCFHCSLSHNNLSGTIPVDLFGCPHLSEFNMDYNQLTGTIPAGNGTAADWLGSIIKSECN